MKRKITYTNEPLGDIEVVPEAVASGQAEMGFTQISGKGSGAKLNRTS